MNIFQKKGNLTAGDSKIHDETKKELYEKLEGKYSKSNMDEAYEKLLKKVLHVAVFDTAFFQNLPEEAARYGLNLLSGIAHYATTGRVCMRIQIAKRLGRPVDRITAFAAS